MLGHRPCLGPVLNYLPRANIGRHLGWSPYARQVVSRVYWPPDHAEGTEDFGSPPKEPTVPVAAPTPSQRSGPFSWSLASELVALDGTLQPESSVGDRRYTSYGAGHMQEVRLQVPGTLCQRIIAAAPSWANATLSLASRVCSSMAAPCGLTTLAAGAGVSVTNRIPFSVNSVVSLSVVDVLQDHHSERFFGYDYTGLSGTAAGDQPREHQHMLYPSAKVSR